MAIYSCDKCSKMFSSKKLLKTHVTKEHKEHRCRVCSTLFPNRFRLFKHLRKAGHKDQPSSALSTITTVTTNNKENQPPLIRSVVMAPRPLPASRIPKLKSRIVTEKLTSSKDSVTNLRITKLSETRSKDNPQKRPVDKRSKETKDNPKPKAKGSEAIKSGATVKPRSFLKESSNSHGSITVLDFKKQTKNTYRLKKPVAHSPITQYEDDLLEANLVDVRIP